MEEVAILHISAERRNLAQIRQFMQEQAELANAETEEVNDLVQAIDEAATNIIVHGYKDSSGEIEIEVQRASKMITIILRDGAPQFDPTQRGMPNLHLPLDQRPLGGLGIYLIKQCVDEMIYRTYRKGGNELTLIKNLLS